MKIALLGYGKMGKEIEEIAHSRNHQTPLIINSKNQNFDDLNKVDVAIEFSTPEAAYQNIMQCIERNTPVVVGTTAWYNNFEEIVNKVQEKNGALLYATNFSLGVNLFFELNKKLSILMQDYEQYDVALEEIHHTQKLDAPSGTAITLANQILDINLNKEQWVNEKSDDINDLNIISKREEGVPGTHTVNYKSDIDSIEIKHIAHNRKGFALGAVIAAEWLAKRRGVFTMKDVLF